jgi:hypothetical protein
MRGHFAEFAFRDNSAYIRFVDTLLERKRNKATIANIENTLIETTSDTYDAHGFLSTKGSGRSPSGH